MERVLVGAFSGHCESSRRFVDSSNNHYIGPWTRAWPLRSRDNQLHNAPSADTAAAAFIEIRT